MDFKFKDMHSLAIDSVWFSDIIILKPKEMPNITYDSDTMQFFIDRLNAFYQNYFNFYYWVDTNTIKINCDCNSIGLTSKFMMVPCKHPKRKGIPYGPKSCTLAMPNHSFCSEYKTGTNYIVQEVTYGYGSDIYPPFAGLYRLKTDFDVYYIANKKYLLDAIRKDSINMDSLTILVPQNHTWGIYDSISKKYRFTINHSMDLYDIMTMDNTEVYAIGGKYYAVKKVKYGYSDEMEVFRSLYNSLFENTDDIQIKNDGEEKYYRETYKSIKEYLPQRQYQYYLFLQEICETDKAIRKHLWKRKYELDEFWQK